MYCLFSPNACFFFGYNFFCHLLGLGDELVVENMRNVPNDCVFSSSLYKREACWFDEGLQPKGTELDEGFYSLFMREEDGKMCLFHDACDSNNMQQKNVGE